MDDDDDGSQYRNTNKTKQLNRYTIHGQTGRQTGLLSVCLFVRVSLSV